MPQKYFRQKENRTGLSFLDSFHMAMKFPIRLAQCFSYFPITTILHPLDGRPLKFKWSPWRLAYAFITFLFFVLEFLALLKQQIDLDPSKKNIFMINGFVFHIGGLIQFYLIFKVTLDWPRIINRWYRIECNMKTYESDNNLSKQLKLITISIMSLAAAEHILVNAYKIKRSFEVEPTVQGAFRNYFKYASYPHVFEVIDYALWKGVILQFINLQRTFNWNFVDVFIMLVGSALSYRLKLITHKLKHLIRMDVGGVQVWKGIRYDYLKCSQLCALVNEKIGYIFLASFSLNLYFVLVQLFGSFLQFTNTMKRIYFVISFGLLLIRLICVCYFGGEVYEEWKNIGFTISSVHSSVYNLEVKRFTNYIATGDILLSGSFFRITRGLILKIAGAVVSYELVLIQYNLDKIRNTND